MAKEEKPKEEEKKETKKEKKERLKKEKKTYAYRKNRRAKQIKFLKIGLISTAVFLLIVYLVLKILYSPGDFTIMLGNDFSRDKGIVMYESIVDKNEKKILAAPKLETMDNISVEWIPKDIHNQKDGSNNGDNYIAYTFYIEHMGIEVLNYWYSIHMFDITRNIDDAIRVMVYLNGERTVYAKLNRNGQPEKDTVPFYRDDLVCLVERRHIQPGDIDKFTILIFIEGDDPDCVDDLIGGMMKMRMEITDEKNVKERIDVVNNNETNTENTENEENSV